MTEREPPKGMTHEELIAFMKTIEPGQVFLAPSGNHYETVRETSGHGYNWVSIRREDGKLFYTHLCDLAGWTRLEDR